MQFCFLNRQLCFLIAWTMLLLSQGRFRLSSKVPLGMQCSMTSINLFCQISQDRFMFIVNTWSQLTELSREHALVKSACLYLQTVLCLLVRDLHESLHLNDSVIPWWSEFPSGGITEQLCNWLGWERRTKSISEPPWGMLGYNLSQRESRH